MEITKLNEALRARRELRDEANKEIAQAIRLCGRAILYIHQDRFEEAERLIEEADKVRKRYKALLPAHPRLYGSVIQLEQELVEAKAFLAYRTNKLYERTDEFPEAYALGLADVLGELRRLAIELARRGELDKAMRVLKDSEELYLKLREIDYTTVKELRHKLDVFRRSLTALKEELTLIKRMKKLAAGRNPSSSEGRFL